jgi:hypothetical protein
MTDRNRTAWNVSLWLNNDEPLYRLAQSYARRIRRGGLTATQAARDMREALPRCTPDGYIYTVPALRAALTDLRRAEC